MKLKQLSYLRRKRRSNAQTTAQLPEYRCIVTRSLKHIGAQIVDRQGNVCVAYYDFKITSGTKKEKARQVGIELAKKAGEKKITTCVFDRNGYLYHGRVKELCEGLREAGLSI